MLAYVLDDEVPIVIFEVMEHHGYFVGLQPMRRDGRVSRVSTSSTPVSYSMCTHVGGPAGGGGRGHAMAQFANGLAMSIPGPPVYDRMSSSAVTIPGGARGGAAGNKLKARATTAAVHHRPTMDLIVTR